MSKMDQSLAGLKVRKKYSKKSGGSWLSNKYNTLINKSVKKLLKKTKKQHQL